MISRVPALPDSVACRVCAVVEIQGRPPAGDALYLRPLATAVRWGDDRVCVPSHVLEMRPAESSYFVLDAAGIARLPGETRFAPGQLQGPLAELEVEEDRDGFCAWIRFPNAGGRAVPAPPPVALRVGDPTLIVGFPGGRPLSVLPGEVLPIPAGASLPAFEGLLRGDQSIHSGMSGSPVFALRSGAASLAGMVVGASESGLPAAPSPRSGFGGARIFPFFSP